ncbi:MULTISPECIES: DUF2442 domain-containing protein [unclassified Bifidobacterium]|uniref:DUF2442 domain-containing protein n=1 Tax=unclassified Bifidobacterium TaxID=2608897 RepID=UPI0023F8BBF6|nr:MULTISPECIES: DUF2442 domain-containing protein [unclassified Bifidobacterium]WEV64630.1 DUF2442 domain-containing protein [Bifidobacterium sp. ESL0732]WEV65237.1 DUF2442 domain-containing protein [Bifidobacterium sp. ESL0764]WEV75959.1 DUF2442 domain-containing protein [Bifidobacterium sp. ESL0800]
MFVHDGIVYADSPSGELEVLDAHATGDYTMVVTFSNGKTRLCDFSEMFDDVPAFAPLRDEAVFEHFQLEDGVLTWQDGSIDISPSYLYNHSYEYDAHGALVSA